MTGEITLRGKVLPVGGIKRKNISCKESKIKEIILCKDNKKNIDENRSSYLKRINFSLCFKYETSFRYCNYKSKC